MSTFSKPSAPTLPRNCRRHYKDYLSSYVKDKTSPGAPPDDVALLVGCEVEAADDGDRFAFRVAHAHQRTRVLAARNKDTRRQWTSTLSGAARTHASKAREQDLAAPAARRRLLAAERRLGVAVERGRVEDG